MSEHQYPPTHYSRRDILLASVRGIGLMGAGGLLAACGSGDPAAANRSSYPNGLPPLGTGPNTTTREPLPLNEGRGPNEVAKEQYDLVRNRAVEVARSITTAIGSGCTWSGKGMRWRALQGKDAEGNEYVTYANNAFYADDAGRNNHSLQLAIGVTGRRLVAMWRMGSDYQDDGKRPDTVYLDFEMAEGNPALAALQAEKPTAAQLFSGFADPSILSVNSIEQWGVCLPNIEIAAAQWPDGRDGVDLQDTAPAFGNDFLSLKRNDAWISPNDAELAALLDEFNNDPEFFPNPPGF